MTDTDAAALGILDIEPHRVSLALAANLAGLIDETDPGEAVLVEQLQLVEPEPWLVDGPDAVYRGIYYGEPARLVGNVTPNFDVGVRDPLDIQGELAPWLRFLPLAPYVGWDIHSPHRAILAPVGYHLATFDYPWALTLNDYRSEATFAWTTDSPQPDYEYFYQCQGDERSIPALCFNGKTGMCRMERYAGASSFDDLTLALVVVPHHGRDDYYPLWEWDGASGDRYTQLRYTKGAISLVKDHRVLATHSSHAKAGEAIIVIVSLNGSDDAGTFLVCDSSRKTVKTLKVSGLSYTSLSGTLGAARTRALYPRAIFSRFADMEILDLVWWNTPMTTAQLETKLGLLAQAWGVRT